MKKNFFKFIKENSYLKALSIINFLEDNKKDFIIKGKQLNKELTSEFYKYNFFLTISIKLIDKHFNKYFILNSMIDKYPYDAYVKFLPKNEHCREAIIYIPLDSLLQKNNIYDIILEIYEILKVKEEITVGDIIKQKRLNNFTNTYIYKKRDNDIINNKYKLYNSNKPKISVIVAVYENEKHIKYCLESIISQTLQDIEVICIDDGGSDSSSTIIKKIMEYDKRIKYYYQENTGPGLARNRGIDYSNGEYIAFLDADDYYISQNALAILYKIAKQNEINVCGGNMYNDYNGKILPLKDKRFIYPYYGKIKYSDYQFDYGYTRFIYSKKFIESNLCFFPNYRRFQDPPFFVKTMIKSNSFVTVDIPIYAWRTRHKQAVTLDLGKAKDLVSGLTENLIISDYYQLAHLHHICISRINYYGKSIKNLLNDNTLMNNLIFFNESINIKLLKKFNYTYSNDYKIAILQ